MLQPLSHMTNLKVAIGVLKNAKSTQSLLENLSTIFDSDKRIEILNVVEGQGLSGRFMIESPDQLFYEDERLEVVVTLNITVSETTASETNGASIEQTAAILIQRCVLAHTGYMLRDQPRVSFPDRRSLYCAPDLVHTVADQHFHGVSFGHLVNNGVFLEHLPVISMHRCMSVFEHDMQRLLTYFRMDNAVVKMTIDYKSIGAIYVDAGGECCLTGDSICPATYSVFLRLLFPPQFFKIVKPQKDLCDNRRVQFADEDPYLLDCHNFVRIPTIPNCPKRETSDCPHMKMIFCLGSDSTPTKFNQFDMYKIVCRLSSRSGAPLYFSNVRSLEGMAVVPKISFQDYGRLCNFECSYNLRVLLSKGRIFRDLVTMKFLQNIHRCGDHNPTALESALRTLGYAFDDGRTIVDLNSAFDRLYNNAISEGFAEEKNYVPRNCIEVRKLIVTPTRKLFKPPEVMMSNRVLRHFGAEPAIRVLFRDEDQSRKIIHNNARKLDADWLNEVVSKFLQTGCRIGPRQYSFLGWSNSQLREHGCYLFAAVTDADGKVQNMASVRNWMGDFDNINSVSKLMARMGQCFTQSEPAFRIPFESNLVAEDEDVKSSKVDPGSLEKEKYVFSDGIGRISPNLALLVSRKLSCLDHILPSAYQIRYRGYKGMVAIDTRLDKVTNTDAKLRLRPSMKKFEAPSSDILEIVKMSEPNPVALNRPLIMILDQIPLHQSKPETHRRMCRTIMSLLEREIAGLADMRLSETACASTLATFVASPLRIDYKKISNRGTLITFTDEPFFQGLLSAYCQQTLNSINKLKIGVPHDKGRTMYGVLDETRTLESGQVFVQYSKELQNPQAETVVLEGRVLVAKNPCMCAGDVRMLTAVRCAELQSMIDVIVFSQKGDRPQPDEMAGSDLDGDEYSVYWLGLDDEENSIYFDQNEMPEYFIKMKSTQCKDIRDQQMINFFQYYIEHDDLRLIANRHLACADRTSLFSQDAKELARKHTFACDFAKSGISSAVCPTVIRKKAGFCEPTLAFNNKSPANNRDCLRCTADCFPDYLNTDITRQSYRSQRLVGRMHRKIDLLQEINDHGRGFLPIVLDPDLEVDGWEDYKEDALEQRRMFNRDVQTLLDCYGIKDEHQLFSGYLTDVRNRVSDGDKEDFSYYNTERLVKDRLTRIVKKFEENFCDDFECLKLNWDEDVDDDAVFDESEAESQFFDPEVRKKAYAWYRLAYNPTDRTFLSFGWIAWRVLHSIKMDSVLCRGLGIQFSNSPLVEALNGLINQLSIAPMEMIQLLDLIIPDPDEDDEDDIDQDEPIAGKPKLGTADERESIHGIFFQYMQVKCVPIIAKILIDCLKTEGIFDDDPAGAMSNPDQVAPLEIAAIFLHYAVNLHKFQALFEDGNVKKIVGVDYFTAAPESISLNSVQHRSPGGLLLCFLKWLGSERFGALTEIRTTFGLPDPLVLAAKPVWKVLNRIAFRAYYHIAITRSFSAIGLRSDSDDRSRVGKYDEGETPFPISFPPDPQSPAGDLAEDVKSDLVDVLIQWSGVTIISLPRKVRNSFIIAAVGTAEARNKLKKIVQSKDFWTCFNSSPRESPVISNADY